MANVYTVRQVNTYIRNMFAQDFMLKRICVRGEVSNCKYHTSGHIYFSLKDESGTIACVMFAGQRGGLSFRMRDGQQVVVSGAVDVYGKTGVYQLYAREIRPDGEGALFERFQALKAELQEMGMFAPEYKQEIPAYARTVGVVTAPTGAAVRDIMNISARRNPYVQLILYPARVQGEGAKESIVRGIRMLERQRVDVIIVGRGGGSIEDLWAFNEEEVARAIFECRTPVISAVGHETDTTIADYVADLRAPTPSAAAELAVWDYRQTALRLTDAGQKLSRRMAERLEFYRLRLEGLSRRFAYQHPEFLIRERRQRLDQQQEELVRLMRDQLKGSRHQLALRLTRLQGLSPLEKLNQGYAFAEKETGDGRSAVTSIRQMASGEALTVYVADGRIDACVTGVREESYD